MERILGLLDTLESMICDSFKVPLTGKILINEAEVLKIMDKIRMVLKSGDTVLTKGARREHEVPSVHVRPQEASEPAKTAQFAEDPEAKAIQIIQQAHQLAREIKSGAEKYADDVLSNMEATSSRILRTVRNGRLRLSKNGPGEAGINYSDIKEISSSLSDEKDNLLSMSK